VLTTIDVNLPRLDGVRVKTDQAAVIRGSQPNAHPTINWRGIYLALFAFAAAAVVMTLGGYFAAPWLLSGKSKEALDCARCRTWRLSTSLSRRVQKADCEFLS
jgi:hypothetical protein